MMVLMMGPDSWNEKICRTDGLIHVAISLVFNKAQKWIVIQYDWLSIFQVHIEPWSRYVTGALVQFILLYQLLIQFWNNNWQIN